jgi:glyoxylase-like metal-dependent hydrolase (beta-lactamase superfamily II)
MASPWTWHLLRAGTLRLDGGGMFGLVPKVMWSKLVTPDEQNRILLQTNCLLLQRDKCNVLIESGCGDKWNDRDRALFAIERRTVVDALAEVGVAPEAITHVIVTHLHFDHAAGLTRREPDGRVVPVFPQAPVFVQRTEWQDAVANKSTMTRTYLREHLDPIADRVRLLDGAVEITELPGVRVLPVPGHTWGMQAVGFEDREGTLCFPGDVLPTANHAGLAFSLGYDMEAYQNMQTKKSLLERATRERWRLILDHEPGNPLVRVTENSQRPGHFLLEPARK